MRFHINPRLRLNRKKAFSLGFVIFASVLSPSFAQQWVLQNSNVTNHLFSVQFVDSMRGWAVGDSGVILRTVNGGQSWERQTSNVNATLKRVFFVDSLVGWIVGYKGAVLFTTDGGQNWLQKILSPKPPFEDVQFVDSLHGWIVGGTQTPDGPFGVIYKTTDGGITWVQKINNDAGGFQGVFFVDTLEGWVVGGKRLFDNFDPDIVLHTTNGGSSWEEQYTPTDGPLYRVRFLDRLHGWAGGFSNPGATVVLRTMNGGVTWQMVSFQNGPIINNSGILDIGLVDTNRIWLVRGVDVYETTNSGISWYLRNPSESSGANSISFVNRYQGWLVRGNGQIWKYIGPSTSVNEIQRTPEGPEIEIFPNPSNSQVVIQYYVKTKQITTIAIYSLLGVKVLEYRIEPKVGVNKKQIDHSFLSSGVYIVNILFSDRIIKGKFILLK